MDIVVDIQCFKDINNIVIPKEVAIVALDGDFIAHWIVSPHTTIDVLSIPVRKENNWLTRHHHGLDYFDGDITQPVLYKTLQDLTRYAGKVYVRGKEKWLILNKLIARDIINLEYDVECPSFAKLPWSDKFCLYHAIKLPHLKYSCALNNASRLKSWLSTIRERYKRIEESDYTFQPPLNLCDEQPGDFEYFKPYPISHCGSIPSRSDPASVDETDSVCSKH